MDELLREQEDEKFQFASFDQQVKYGEGKTSLKQVVRSEELDPESKAMIAEVFQRFNSGLSKFSEPTRTILDMYITPCLYGNIHGGGRPSLDAIAYKLNLRSWHVRKLYKAAKSRIEGILKQQQE